MSRLVTHLLLMVPVNLLLPCLSSAAGPPAKTLRVLQLNVWQEGTSVPGGNDKIADVILASRADVVAFSEVRNYNQQDWHQKIIGVLKAKAPDMKFHGKFVGGDVGLISRYPIDSTESVFDETRSDSGSIMAYRLKIEIDHLVTVCTAHLDYKRYALNWVRGYGSGDPHWKMLDAGGDGEPDHVADAAAILEHNHKSRRDEAVDDFFAFSIVERSVGRAVILAGDFNEGSHLDWTPRAKDFAGHYGVALQWPNSRLLREAGVRDAYRTVFPDELKHPGFTWPAPAHGKATTSWAPKSDERDRIDFIYASGDGRLTPVNAWIVGPKTTFIGKEKVADPGDDQYLCDDLPWPSDHKGVLVEFKISTD